MGKSPIPACTQQDNLTCTKLPIVNCRYNSTVIYLLEADSPAVYQDENCYIIQGRGFELVKAIDRFIYGIYGIMT